MKNIRVTYRYLYSNPVKRTTSMSYLIRDLIQTRATFLQQWLDSDEVYDPTNDFKVTKLELDKNQNINHVELTEMENPIYE